MGRWASALTDLCQPWLPARVLAGMPRAATFVVLVGVVWLMALFIARRRVVAVLDVPRLFATAATRSVTRRPVAVLDVLDLLTPVVAASRCWVIGILRAKATPLVHTNADAATALKIPFIAKLPNVRPLEVNA